MFGEVKNPLANWGWGGIANAQKGPLNLLSNTFQLLAVVAGIYALINMIMAGFKFISSNGDSSKVEEAQKQMYMSLMGLIVIVISFSVAAILGKLLFGNPSFIFKPVIYGPGTVPIN